jgi:hypothetical protein
MTDSGPGAVRRKVLPVGIGAAALIMATVAAPATQAGTGPTVSWSGGVVALSESSQTSGNGPGLLHLASSQGEERVALWTVAEPTDPGAPLPGGLRAAASTDRGKSWTEPQDLKPPEQRLDFPYLSDTPIALSGDGQRAYAAWDRANRSADSRPGSSVEFAVSDDGGRTWQSPVTLSDSSFWAPKVFAASKGARVTVVWADCDDCGDGGGEVRFLARTSRDGGRTWSRPGAVAKGPGDNPAWDAAVSDDARRVTVVWTRSARPAPTKAARDVLESATSRNGGRSWAKPRTVSKRYSGAPDVAVSGDGRRKAVVWSEWSQDGGRPLHTRVASAKGIHGAWSKAARLEADGWPDQSGPQLVLSADGDRAVATWGAYAGPKQRKGTRVWAAGTPDIAKGASNWSAPQIISKKVKRTRSHALVGLTAARNAKTVTAMWQDLSSRTDKVYTAASTSGGTQWGRSRLVPAQVQGADEKEGRVGHNCDVTGSRNGRRLVAGCSTSVQQPGTPGEDVTTAVVRGHVTR